MVKKWSVSQGRRWREERGKRCKEKRRKEVDVLGRRVEKRREEKKLGVR